MNCQACRTPLNQSVYNADKTKKSCPSCSKANGQFHVFHNFPSAFGTTEKRISNNDPIGAQSYCTICRGSNGPNTLGITCNNITLTP